MSAESIPHPQATNPGESKSARKKKAKAEAAIPTLEKTSSEVGSGVPEGKSNGIDGGSENAYIKELQKWVWILDFHDPNLVTDCCLYRSLVALFTQVVEQYICCIEKWSLLECHSLAYSYYDFEKFPIAINSESFAGECLGTSTRNMNIKDRTKLT